MQIPNRTLMNGKNIHVFSASAYLRGLKHDFVDISMVRFERRLGLIQELRKEKEA